MAPDLAGDVAREPTRLEACRQYWWRTLVEFGIEPGALHRVPALVFADNLPHQGLSNLSLVSGRRHLTDERDAKHMVGLSGCGLSLASIARAQKDVGESDVLPAVEALTGGGPLTIDEASRAIRVVREVLDIVRGYAHCQENAAALGTVALDELISVFRQESAWVMAPDWSSFPHAPLVRTHAGDTALELTCRSPKVQFSWPAERPGYNLVVEAPDQYDLRNQTSARLWLTFCNLVITGGLDSVARPPMPDTLTDLTWALISSGPGGFKRIRPLMKSFSNDTERRCLWRLTAGLLLARVEQEGPWSTSPGVLSNNVADDVEGLIGAHRYESGGGRLLHLLDDRRGTAVATCLAIQARWYESRSRYETLLATADRRSVSAPAERLSPFLTYWRYNAGERNLVDTILRLLVRLDTLDTLWRKRALAWGTALPDALSASNLDRTWLRSDLPRLYHRWKAEVRSRTIGRRNRQDVMWREIGLVDALFRSGRPSWLASTRFTPVDPVATAAAGVARELLPELDRQGLPPVLDAALEWTPVPTLRELGVVFADTAVPSRVHSFERLRRVFEDALP